jgi:hypothetical protein
MLRKRITKLLATDSENRLLIFAERGITELVGLSRLLKDAGFIIYEYEDVERFRIVYEETIKASAEKTAVLVMSEIYVPYDIRRSFRSTELSAAALFPQLNANSVMKHARDWDIISLAYESNYSDLSLAAQTEKFIRDTVFSEETVRQYCNEKKKELLTDCEAAASYRDWIEIAKTKATIEYYAAKKNIRIDLSFADEAFGKFIASGYSRLSSEVGDDFPSIITKTLSSITAGGNEKTALIVMDGMSLFDFETMSRYWTDIEYAYGASFALIPTTTPISRQSLLSGKYPCELAKPFSLANEEKEFRMKTAELGFGAGQVEYLRGFDADISPLSKLVAIIINEVDDIVHGQHQGRAGMYNDMDLFGRSGRLQSLISRLAGLGFSVCVTADHGNTPCVGVGGFRSGVEVESRSMRMAILKDFAEANVLLKENTMEYQGYYLDKSYRYFVCKNGVSFDSKGEQVLTHGGMSIDEVIVPFIRINEVK